MTNQHSLVFAGRGDHDLFTSSRNGESSLNAAIVRAEINESFEELLDIFDAFYADDVEVSDDTREEPIRGKANLSSTSWSRFTSWPKSVVWRYRFERPRFPEMLQTRRILRGLSTLSESPGQPAR
jgi:hypothetical protein